MSGEEEAKYTLEALGFQVELVPVSDTKSPDLRVKLGGEFAIVEVKDRYDSKEYIEARRKALSDQGHFTRSLGIKGSNRLSAIARGGTKQINAVSPAKEVYRILWFNLKSSLGESGRRILRKTIYGCVDIQALGDPIIRPCYFFNDSVFFACRDELDAVVSAVIDSDAVSVKLHLNPLSPRFASLQESAMIRLFGDAVENPIEAEACGAYFLGKGADRSSVDSKLAWIAERYATGPNGVFAFLYASYEMLISKD